MGDWIDEAVALQEQLLEAALANRPRPAPSSSTCLNCLEPLTDRVNYCDTDCRDDHQKRTGSRARTLSVLDDE